MGERLEQRECAACGTPMTYAGTGRRPRFCSASCRRAGWAFEHAAARLADGDDPRPEIVRETVTQERVRVVNRPDTAPNTADEWTRQLPALTHQLGDPRSAVAHADRAQRHRLAARLLAALSALHEADPNACDWQQLAAIHPSIAHALADTPTAAPRPPQPAPPAPPATPAGSRTPGLGPRSRIGLRTAPRCM